MTIDDVHKAELEAAYAFHKVATQERDLARVQLLAARADLREAMELLQAHGQAPSWLLSVGKFGAVKDWNRRYGELLAKHKETP